MTDLDAFGPEPGPPNLGAPAVRTHRRHTWTWLGPLEDYYRCRCGATRDLERSRRGKSASRLGKDQERRIERVYGPRKVGEFGDAIDLIGRDFVWQSKASRNEPPLWLARCDTWVGIHGLPPFDWRLAISAMDPIRQDKAPLLIRSYVSHGKRTRDWIILRLADWIGFHGSAWALTDSAWIVMTGEHFLSVHGRDTL